MRPRGESLAGDSQSRGADSPRRLSETLNDEELNHEPPNSKGVRVNQLGDDAEICHGA